jgi:hypothetical protein
VFACIAAANLFANDITEAKIFAARIPPFYNLAAAMVADIGLGFAASSRFEGSGLCVVLALFATGPVFLTIVFIEQVLQWPLGAMSDIVYTVGCSFFGFLAIVLGVMHFRVRERP